MAGRETSEKRVEFRVSGQAYIGFELVSDRTEKKKRKSCAAWVRTQKGERLSSVNLQALVMVLTYFSATRMV